MNLGAYEIFEAVSKLPDPDWPPLDFWQVIKIGFRDRLVDRLDHPVIKRLGVRLSGGSSSTVARRPICVRSSGCTNPALNSY